MVTDSASIENSDRLSTIEAYRFDLPEELVAQEPGERGASRLLRLDRHTGARAHRHFADLPDLLPQGALLVANNSRVVPVRLLGQTPTGGKCECFILSPMPLLVQEARHSGSGRCAVAAHTLLRPGKAMQPGRTLHFGPDSELSVTVTAKGEFGHHDVILEWVGEAANLLHILNRIGHMPLPPYIRRPDAETDRTRYQTVYARPEKAGSAAAPTAGLHFTPAMRETLAQRGFQWAELTLHVGYGTFSPVRAHNLDEHVMHAEYLECSPETAAQVAAAKAEGRPVIAVGTTSCRSLEGIARACGGMAPFSGFTDIFIRPGYTFSVADGLITNFHLPESTLLMLVCALAGYDQTLAAYNEAVAERYRFFSYGDAMLVI